MELKSLPAACVVKFKWDEGHGDPAQVEKWKNILGGAFWSMHHYCIGLNCLNRVDRGIGDKGALLGEALGQFKYMQGIPADNVLRPEVEYNIGLVLYRMDRISQAIGQLRRTIQMKPNYERAYLLLDICYLRLGDRASAAAALREGLKRVPNSRALQDALNKMTSEKEQPDGPGQR
jgi:tetratricopeptide (TPR) repeat protein